MPGLPACSRKVWMRRPLCPYHTRTVSSRLPVTTRRLSAEIAADRAPGCSYSCSVLPVDSDTSRTPDRCVSIRTDPHRQRVLHRLRVDRHTGEPPIFPFVRDVITRPQSPHDCQAFLKPPGTLLPGNAESGMGILLATDSRFQGKPPFTNHI